MPKSKRPPSTKSTKVTVQQLLALAAQTINRAKSGERNPILVPLAAPKWKPKYQPAKLYSPSARAANLTSLGQLILAQALLPGGKGINIEKLLPFADNEFEQKLFRLLHDASPGCLANWEDPLDALFYLRVLHIPVICRGLLLLESRNTQVGLLWLGILSAYSVAFERVLLERLFDALYRKHKQHLNGEEMRAWVTCELGKTINSWFSNTPQGPLFWVLRFNQWRDYAVRSLLHFIGEQSIDIRRMSGNLKEAAVLGVLKNLQNLPQERCSDLMSRVCANKQAHKVFLKNARKRVPKPSSIDLDTFLIECWPVVLQYGWSYRELELVQDLRFQNSKERNDELIQTPRELKERCVRLELSLSNAGRRKVGRSKADMKSKLPPLYNVALMIDSIGGSHDDWFWGVTDAGFRSLSRTVKQ